MRKQNKIICTNPSTLKDYVRIYKISDKIIRKSNKLVKETMRDSKYASKLIKEVRAHLDSLTLEEYLYTTIISTHERMRGRATIPWCELPQGYKDAISQETQAIAREIKYRISKGKL